MKKYLFLLFFLFAPFNFVLANPDGRYYDDHTTLGITILWLFLFLTAFIFEWPIFILFFRKNIPKIKIFAGVLIANLISVSLMLLIVRSAIFLTTSSALVFLTFFEIIVLIAEFFIYNFYFQKVLKKQPISEKINKLKLALVVFLANFFSLLLGYLLFYIYYLLQLA